MRLWSLATFLPFCFILLFMIFLTALFNNLLFYYPTNVFLRSSHFSQFRKSGGENDDDDDDNYDSHRFFFPEPHRKRSTPRRLSFKNIYITEVCCLFFDLYFRRYIRRVVTQKALTFFQLSFYVKRALSFFFFPFYPFGFCFVPKKKEREIAFIRADISHSLLVYKKVLRCVAEYVKRMVQ